ncbi:trehalose-6-phosphate synthase [Lipingzhangella sp. LS1_29]|uniref:Trehalose-6-phosphate synthase n=1 Tax=Lipingzhangella rawalii TaxID=2055835 RepID=A0ABU2H4J2_9ACTN|nr:trehalose-6-phosphate synthase [Lipingzhangella rawalii]MDS1270216.1 trehalose-6-phosphate synthase [Lipingzhangella rawalii]
MPPPERATVLVASNRGPISITTDEHGHYRAQRGGGGLVSGLSALGHRPEYAGTQALWVCAALSETDRQAARSAPGGRLDQSSELAEHLESTSPGVQMLDIPVETFTGAYTTIANSVLWFVHHLLFDIPNHPQFDARFRERWEDYVAYNAAFGEALASAAAPGARVFVQDYHLALVPRMLRERRPDLRVSHFSHTPWAPVEYFRLLPPDIRVQLLDGMLGADHLGFHTQGWARAFTECCTAELPGEVAVSATNGWEIRRGGRVVRVGVHPLGVDAAGLRSRAAEADVAERRAELSEAVGDRKLLVRIDRTELSKNIVRGLAGFRELLQRHPEWRRAVTHLAFAYPSRTDVPEYRSYTESVRELAASINSEFGTEDWTPVLLEVRDDFARSLAAYQLADVLVVNPIRDGMNLVAKEGPILSERDSVLVLSTGAGAVEELGEDALLVHPYDVSATADALDTALRMPPGERQKRRERLADRAAQMPPHRWFTEQLTHLG